jgi:Pyruvate/2-oxoacid:ferredoxin oxidoreductase gamma subunit
MEGMAVIGFVFGMMGMVAFVRLDKLIKTLKEKGILEENYKDE